ncbi:MAG: NAD(P)H-quinone oxidoreductase [Propionibacteriaceae bacterium]|jgi:putative PIG3 family NAD(P)H quinone oxidoreductase|nr:NAD(P)H-quinone oxidoreductase [Propionibacteriaceae bacterium]
MRVITVAQPGGPEELRLTTTPIPEPGPGEVRLAVAAAGLNRADLLQRRGFYPPPPGASDILGLEVSGWVDALGPGVTAPVLGEPVVALLTGGGYAEFAVVPAVQCAPVPRGVGLTEAAAIMETAATVVSNFDSIRVRPGETILIHGGTGGIGSFAIPYAKYLGLTVMTTVGRAAKAAHARAAGADVVVDYHEDWAAAVRAATGGRGVDAILDIIGAKYLEANVGLLAHGGRLVVIGLQGGRKATLDLNQLLTKAATITATSLRLRPVAEKAAIVRAVVDRVWPLFESGAIPLPPITTFPLADARAAHELLESGEARGKVLLSVNQPSGR